MNVITKITVLFSLLLVSSIGIAQQGQLQGQAANSNSNSGALSGSSSGSSANSQGGHSSASTMGNNQGMSITSYGSDLSRARKNTPSVLAPALASTLTDTCMGSVTGGGSGAGFGVAFGKTYVDKECVRRLHAKFLASAGQGAVAMQIMCSSDVVAEATARIARSTGKPDVCLSDKEEEKVAAGPTETYEDMWRFKEREQDDFIY